MPITGFMSHSLGMVNPFVGPGDIVSGAIRFWSLRAYSTGSVGSNAIRLRRSSDNGEQDFATISGGGLDLTAITTFKGAANLFVRTLYDQGTATPSGGTNDRENAIQTTAGDQPAFILNGMGSLPVMRFTSAAEFFDQTNTTVQVQPLTISVVVKRTGAFTSFQDYFRESGNGIELVTNNTADSIIFQDSSGAVPTGTAADNTFHSFIGVANDPNSILNINGVSSSPSAALGTGGLAGNLLVGARGDGSLPVTGDIVEIGVWPIAMNDAQMSAISSNQHAYWGF